jgi:hypothetical protein
MPNYGYHLARFQGRVVQRAYERLLPLIVGRRIRCRRELPIDVFSYSGQSRLAEQVASIRSFLQNAGRPNRFVVVSDGSHTLESIKLLCRVDECASVESVPAPDPGAGETFDAYLRNHPTGKQLALVMSLPREKPALYIDSDVRFFSRAADLQAVVESNTAPAFYLQDCGFAGDRRLLRSDEDKLPPVNTGVLLIRHPLDWSLAVDRFAALNGPPDFFTNQTLTHLVMHANRAQPFDPAKYVLQLDDQFVYRDRYAGSKIALRHYVDPVRHKFWTTFTR